MTEAESILLFVYNVARSNFETWGGGWGTLGASIFKRSIFLTLSQMSEVICEEGTTFPRRGEQ